MARTHRPLAETSRPMTELAEGRDMGLGIDSETVEEANVSPCWTPPRRSPSPSWPKREKSFLLAYCLSCASTSLLPRLARVNSVERVVADAQERRLMSHLSELVLRRERDNRDVVIDFPLVDDLAVLQVHPVQHVGIGISFAGSGCGPRCGA